MNNKNIKAYLSHTGEAISPSDFGGGADEMHQMAKTEGWTALIALPARQADADDWNLSGTLLYKLKNGVNHSEIRVSMFDGSRSEEACETLAAHLEWLVTHWGNPMPEDCAVLPMDFLTHMGDWERACNIAYHSSTDNDDKSYWQHQMTTLENLRKRMGMTEKKKPEQKSAALWEIVNMSDPYTIRGDFELVSLAIGILGKGKYAGMEIDGDRRIPLFIFGGTDQWFMEQFGVSFDNSFLRVDKNALADVFDSVVIGSADDRQEFEAIIHGFSTDSACKAFRLERHEKMLSSMNDIASYAYSIADSLRLTPATKDE